MLARFKFIISQIFIIVFKEYRHVWFLRTVSENTNFVLSKNCSYSLNLVFSMFFKKKKKEPNMFSMIFVGFEIVHIFISRVLQEDSYFRD